MVVEAIEAEELGPPPEPYSYAIRAGKTLYLAGQVALDAEGRVVGETAREQAAKVWENIRAVLAAADASLDNVVKVTYYMQDIREIAEEIEVRTQVFSGRHLPAVTAVQVAALGLPGLKMEVDVTAVLP